MYDPTIINKQLKEHFGLDTESNNPMWRVVWCEDQYEKRLIPFDVNGNQLLTPEARVVKKYGGWISEKWLLENLVAVPPHQVEELCGRKISYECIFVFQDEKENSLPPNLEVAKLVINLVMAAKGKKFSTAKYQQDPEAAKKELDSMMEELYGEGTDVADALHHGEGIVVPSKFFGDN